ncbi:hypothetical protein BC936DRAFT_144519 [Jimgerdemannia flammicorona]|uniref:Uncharacterized protein n=1 Tax=Jimgerdemannia flammicorona TaxID=994334 RepID=A0A432ZXU1_9FUNG|nr:hypothetical protein BC936DRAFT_144519 [Jimgerdemannia flammicorona]
MFQAATHPETSYERHSSAYATSSEEKLGDEQHRQWHHCEFCTVGFTCPKKLAWHFDYCKPYLNQKASSQCSSRSSVRLWNPLHVAQYIKDEIVTAVKRSSLVFGTK